MVGWGMVAKLPYASNMTRLWFATGRPYLMTEMRPFWQTAWEMVHSWSWWSYWETEGYSLLYIMPPAAILADWEMVHNWPCGGHIGMVWCSVDYSLLNTIPRAAILTDWEMVHNWPYGGHFGRLKVTVYWSQRPTCGHYSRLHKRWPQLALCRS